MRQLSQLLIAATRNTDKNPVLNAPCPELPSEAQQSAQQLHDAPLFRQVRGDEDAQLDSGDRFRLQRQHRVLPLRVIRLALLRLLVKPDPDAAVGGIWLGDGAEAPVELGRGFELGEPLRSVLVPKVAG